MSREPGDVVKSITALRLKRYFEKGAGAKRPQPNKVAVIEALKQATTVAIEKKGKRRVKKAKRAGKSKRRG